jgi:hypothetical protein
MVHLAPKPHVPVLAAELPLTNNDDRRFSEAALDERDALSLPSDDSGFTSGAECTSPASSVRSGLHGDPDEGRHYEMQLPKPFYPPSMAQVDEKVDGKPRLLPANFNLPKVPQERAISAIDPQDKWVIFISYMLEIL